MILQVPIPTEGSQTIKQASNKKLRGDNKYYDKNKTWWQRVVGSSCFTLYDLGVFLEEVAFKLEPE